MVKLDFYKNKDIITGFKIDNHALVEREMIMAGEAYDMICNSVSVLSQSVLIGLDEVLKLNVPYEISNGYIKLDLKELDEDEIQKAQVLLKTFELSIESILISLEQSFGKNKTDQYICVKKEEV
ncbi:ribosomal-processing cysteine protease Prp [Clostridium manihotivorum]|uniref:Ribosomal processing cysteine protease Prp n=1 Tax=Clostridium manihotivorum TaxID=2320868 RepID=A0A410DR51_9CLOT|nr:ribosomal-processing cysteine protease Prp [Clostridium manihotivorum]QAA31517.1 ribosomal-processing cysteine protease Prp [Clostridium manihotivorum]